MRACSEGGGGIAVEASHDGYVAALQPDPHAPAARSTRRAAGSRAATRLSAAKGVLRFAWDLPFAIHFHLHPEAEAQHRSDARRR